jgi:hypothetical protein
MARPALATAEALETGYDALVGAMARGDQSALAALYDTTSTAVHALVIPSDEGALLFIVETP